MKRRPADRRPDIVSELREAVQIALAAIFAGTGAGIVAIEEQQQEAVLLEQAESAYASVEVTSLYDSELESH